MNTFDKSSLFQLSFAFMRRFAFVEVSLPTDEGFRNLLKEHGASCGLTNGSAKTVGDFLIVMLMELFVPPSGSGLDQFNLRVGPAIPLDMIRYLGARAPKDVAGINLADLTALATTLFLEACEAFLYPQFEGQDKRHEQILSAIDAVAELDQEQKERTARRLAVWTGFHQLDQSVSGE
jgi:hypothetical protein